jgi:hypothetical protein
MVTLSRLKALITVIAHATARYWSSVKAPGRLRVDLLGHVLGLGQPGHRIGERQRGALLLGVQARLPPGAEQVDAPFGLAELAGVPGVHVQAERAPVEHRAADLDQLDQPLVESCSERPDFRITIVTCLYDCCPDTVRGAPDRLT